MVQVGGQLFDVARQHTQIDDTDRGKFMLALHRSKSREEAGDAFFKTTTQRTHGLAVIRQFLQRFLKNTGHVAQTVEIGLKVGRRRFRPFTRRRRHGDQVTGEVAAIHRRNIAGAQRL